MNCEICGPEINHTSVFRNAPKGKGCEPHWRCKEHLDEEYRKKAESVFEIVSIIEGKGAKQ